MEISRLIDLGLIFSLVSRPKGQFEVLREQIWGFPIKPTRNKSPKFTRKFLRDKPRNSHDDHEFGQRKEASMESWQATSSRYRLYSLMEIWNVGNSLDRLVVLVLCQVRDTAACRYP